MKLPKKIRILAFDYTLESLDYRSGDAGVADPDNLIISLRDGQPESVQRDTLLHEIIHCLNYHLQLLDRPTDEDIASRISTGLLTVFRANPALTRWFFSLK